MVVDAEIKAAFDKIYGDMTLSESDVALSILEYGYKAGQEALRKALEQPQFFYGQDPNVLTAHDKGAVNE